MVGDADQSIYAFRGATIRNILEFERDYPDARTILLEQNYRSTQTILTAANAVIDRNTDRKPKNLWSDAGRRRADRRVRRRHRARRGRLGGPRDRPARRRRASVRPGDVAVFYRTNAQSRVFEEVFIRLGLPYKVVGGVRFYERKEVRDALAYLRAIANADDTVSVRRILNTPRRGIGDRAEACVEALASRERISFGAALRRADEAPGISPRAATAIADFVALLDELREVSVAAPPEEVLEAVLRRSGYLRELEESTDPQDEGRVENLQELVSVAREYTERIEARPRTDRTPAPTLAGFLEQVSLVADADQIPADDPDHSGVVTLMTLHTAKGLEFPVVFLTGLEDGVFPHLRSLGDTAGAGGGAAAGLRGHHPGPAAALPVPGGHPVGLGAAAYNPPSRFLEEVPEELIDWERTEPRRQPPAQARVAATGAGPRDAQGRRRQPADPRAGPRRQGQATTRSGSARSSRSGARRRRRRRRSTSAPTSGRSGCCCGTPPLEKL